MLRVRLPFLFIKRTFGRNFGSMYVCASFLDGSSRFKMTLCFSLCSFAAFCLYTVLVAAAVLLKLSGQDKELSYSP